MDQLSNFISEYLKTCETIKKIKFKNHQSIPYRFITISYIYATTGEFHRKIYLKLVPVTVTPKIQAQNSQKEDCYFEGIFPLSCL